MAKNIPIDIIFEILQWLPIKSIQRFRCVCKSWNNMLKTTNFIESHLQCSLKTNPNAFFTYVHDSSLYQVFDINRPSSITNTTKLSWDNVRFSRVIGSCNGLVCVLYFNNFHCDDGSLALCNPCTRTLKKVPYLSSTLHAKFGFGYDPLSDDYKIVSVLRKNVSIYSCKSNAWATKIDDSCMKIPGGEAGYALLDHGTLANNNLHWIHNNEIILSFDLHKETFDFLPLPNKESRLIGLVGLGFFKGCLTLVGFANDPTTPAASKTDIWIMKEYGKVESWTKLLSFSNMCNSIGAQWWLKCGRAALQSSDLYERRSTKMMVNMAAQLREGRREDMVEFVDYVWHVCHGGMMCFQSLIGSISPENNGGDHQLIKLVGKEVDMMEELKSYEKSVRKRNIDHVHQIRESRRAKERKIFGPVVLTSS